MKRAEKKKAIAMMLGFVIIISVLISGCGGGDSSGQKDALSGSETGQGASQYAEGTPMGRYVESQADLSGGMGLSGNGNGLYKLDNGQIIITDSIYPFLISKDKGVNWFEDKRTWRSQMIEEGTFILSAAIGGDNTAAVIYQEEEESSAEGEVVLNPKLLIIKPDKTEIQAEVTLTEADERLRAVYISGEGRIFVTTLSSNIYEIMEDGSNELFLTVEEGVPELIQFQDNFMLIDGIGYDSLLIYDMEQEEYMEDKVLEDFVAENYGDRSGFCGNWYHMFFFGGEDGVLYIAGEKGVYRHVLGGSVMEQIIDGNLSIFSNPSYAVAGMTAYEDNRFLTLFSNGTLVWFTYNPDIPTVPIEQIKIYGLEDDEAIRQAINQYQTKHPEIYVEYEVGMGGDSSITREDALKSLNTKIMAGDGPDILVLDDMPADSYIEKGILRDISSVFDNRSGDEELFDNIVDAFRTGDAVYMMPCEVQLPVVLGKKDEIASIQSMETIADMMEQLRAENAERDLLGLCTERGVMRLFSPLSVPEWMTEEGEVNKEAISEFLTQVKRIYDAQMDGISDEALDTYDEWENISQENHGMPWDETDLMRTNIGSIRLIGEYKYILWGAVTDPYSYSELISIPQTKGFESYGWKPAEGSGSEIFTARTLVGISAVSNHQAEAEEFVKELFGKENQKNLYQGIPVNKAAFLESYTAEEEGERWGSLATDDKEGNMISQILYAPDWKQTEELQKYMESVKVPYIENTVLEEAVYGEGVAYLQGTKSLPEAVDSIEKKMAIYLAE